MKLGRLERRGIEKECKNGVGSGLGYANAMLKHSLSQSPLQLITLVGMIIQCSYSKAEASTKVKCYELGGFNVLNRFFEVLTFQGMI